MSKYNVELRELVNLTRTQLTDEQEKEIRDHIESILEILNRHDICEAIERVIPDMNKDKYTNWDKIKDFVYSLTDVINLSR